MKFLIAFVVCVYSIVSHAKTTVYSEVKQLEKALSIAKAIDDQSSVLVVMDIDDTLLEAASFVGSDSWYNWQRGKPSVNENGEPIRLENFEQYHCIFGTLGTLFELGLSEPTQDNAATIVSELQQNDFMLLTSRSPDYRGATERELRKVGLTIGKSHLLDKDLAFAYDFNDGNRSAPVTYQNGIVMSSGLNKGLVLQNILSRLNKQYQTIIFVDDSLKNVENMNSAWRDSETMVHIIHYTHVDKSISAEERHQSQIAKQNFEEFMEVAFPKRYQQFKENNCR